MCGGFEPPEPKTDYNCDICDCSLSGEEKVYCIEARSWYVCSGCYVNHYLDGKTFVEELVDNYSEEELADKLINVFGDTRYTAAELNEDMEECRREE